MSFELNLRQRLPKIQRKTSKSFGDTQIQKLKLKHLFLILVDKLVDGFEALTDKERTVFTRDMLDIIPDFPNH